MVTTDIDLIEQQWQSLRSKIKQRWPALKMEEIQRTGGNTDMLVELLCEKYGYSRRYAEEGIHQFLRRHTAVGRMNRII